MERLEEVQALDGAAERLEPVARPLLASSRTADVLRGRWLGHALHPLLTDFPIGAWTSSALLDAFGGPRARPAADGLLAFGLAAAVPTVLTGIAEWAATSGRERRVGVVHAVMNAVAAGFYGASLAARRSDRRSLGVTLSLGGAVALTAGGYLGSHLSLSRKVASTDPAFER
ncbi:MULTISPECIES: DUF2231 domain-containing protein [Thermomonospora]|uniref:Putative membrane protein n=1 Tax=Thermomonospora cellulosilytica TaxID=1411118 RepID=A0A7W3R6Z2_9ACTN|nr:MULTISPECIES: DUF2231 domain-containing protein [Thermomonospora]MBA9002728.1 putative membrane protein [Thermomonospora cellulosilytica]